MVIGVTRCSRMDDYVASVEAVGGRVRVIEAGDDPEAAFAGIDGLLLTGGGDVDPRCYGAPRHPATDDGEPGRDALEIALARKCLASDLPLLGICRGMQVLNVAAGGSLVQDIPTEVGGAVPHCVAVPKDAVAHEVSVAAGTRLSAVLAVDGRPRSTCAVNSRHHQAAREVPAALTVSATAPDGVIEAIERSGARFCLAVQWHPENFWRSGEFRPLFEAFVRAALPGGGRRSQ